MWAVGKSKNRSRGNIESQAIFEVKRGKKKSVSSKIHSILPLPPRRGSHNIIDQDDFIRCWPSVFKCVLRRDRWRRTGKTARLVRFDFFSCPPVFISNLPLCFYLSASRLILNKTSFLPPPIFCSHILSYPEVQAEWKNGQRLVKTYLSRTTTTKQKCNTTLLKLKNVCVTLSGGTIITEQPRPQ